MGHTEVESVTLTSKIPIYEEICKFNYKLHLPLLNTCLYLLC